MKECYESVKSIFNEKLPGYDYEHIFTDNNSTDKTIKILKEIARNDIRVKIIINSSYCFCNFVCFCSNHGSYYL